MSDLLETIAIETGKAILQLGLDELRKYLSDDEIHEHVASILPEISESRKAQLEIERNTSRDSTGQVNK